MKKACSVFLAVALLLSVLTGVSFSVSAETEGDFSYKVSKGEATIIDYIGDGGDVAIPSSLGGYPVTTIGTDAFYQCTELTSVIIPNSVKALEFEAFSECTGLTEIEIPASVKTIGNRVFLGCNGLKRIAVEEGNAAYYSSGNCLIKKKDGTLVQGCASSVIPDGVKKIGSFAFYGCTGLTNLEIPDSVTEIGSFAFASCTGLTDIRLSNRLNTIGERAFASCTGLTSILLPHSLVSIWHAAFYCCTGLTSIEIPENVAVMKDSVFSGCDSLTDIYCLVSRPPNGWLAWTFSGCHATIHWGEAMPKQDDPDDPQDEPQDEPKDEPKDEPQVLATGDLGGDGEIDATDYMLLKRAVLETYTLTEAQRKAADINGDGEVNATDYMLLKRAVLGTYVIG